jgi:hypothetical protein
MTAFFDEHAQNLKQELDMQRTGAGRGHTAGVDDAWQKP